MIQSNLTKNNISNMPDFVYVPPDLPITNQDKRSFYNDYIAKFKSAVYAFVLFLMLSSAPAYKILDIVLKLFTNNIEIVDEECMEPSILGRIIMGAIMALGVFIL